MSNMKNFKEAFNSIFGTPRGTKAEPVSNGENSVSMTQQLQNEPVSNQSYQSDINEAINRHHQQVQNDYASNQSYQSDFNEAANRHPQQVQSNYDSNQPNQRVEMKISNGNHHQLQGDYTSNQSYRGSVSNMKNRNYKQQLDTTRGRSSTTAVQPNASILNERLMSDDDTGQSYRSSVDGMRNRDYQQSDTTREKMSTTAVQPNASILNERLNGFNDREAGRTIISSDTKIEGSIISNSNLDVDGTVLGDVVTTESICVSGKLKGDIKAYAVEIDGGHILGETKAVSVLRASEKAIMSGDISCVDIEMFGKVQGNITSKRLHVHKDAVVLGDILTDEIAIEFGARVRGQLDYSSDVKADDLNLEIE